MDLWELSEPLPRNLALLTLAAKLDPARENPLLLESMLAYAGSEAHKIVVVTDRAEPTVADARASPWSPSARCPCRRPTLSSSRGLGVTVGRRPAQGCRRGRVHHRPRTPAAAWPDLRPVLDVRERRGGMIDTLHVEGGELKETTTRTAGPFGARPASRHHDANRLGRAAEGYRFLHNVLFD